MAAASGELAGHTFMVTGGNTGIGRATAAGLAGRGGRVYLACRSPDKGRAAVADIVAATGNDAVAFLPLDLASLASVRECAERFLALGEPLHALINNAGVAGRRGITTDGFELTFGVNHLGHFALTAALLGRLAASAPARVVTVASDAHYQATGVDFAAVRRRTASITGTPEYAVSKLCNVLFSAEQGATTSLYCATSSPVATASGCYYENSREREPSSVATPDLARALWEQSQAWVTADPHT